MTASSLTGAFALVGALLSQPAPAPAPPALPDTEALQHMCRDGGAMDYAFGDTGVPNSSRIENSLGFGWKLGAGFRPFEKAQALATPWSNRLVQVSYNAGIKNEAEGRRAVEALVRAAEGAGWQRKAEWDDSGQLPLYLLPIAGDAVFELPGGGGIIASFGWALGELTMSCGQNALLRANAEEAFGRLPEGTPRPQPPALKLQPAFVAEDCGRPEVQEEMLSILEGRPNGAIGKLLHAASYSERLHQWKSWKLQSSGKVSDERMMKLALAALETGSPGGDPMAGFALFPKLFDAFGRLVEEAEAGDRAAACRTSFDLLGVYKEMELVAARQWKTMDAAIEAEARKVGVSLD